MAKRIYPNKGNYEWVAFCEKCNAAVFAFTKTNYPHCYCLKFNSMCFAAWRKCKFYTTKGTDK